MDQKFMRRLSDKIIAAHRQACDEDKMDVADMLLQALEVDLSSIGGAKSESRESIEMLEEAFIRHHDARMKHGPG
jgi:hypothetical protein